MPSSASPAQPIRLCFVGWGEHVHTERWVAQYVRPGYDVRVISLSGRGVYPAAVHQYHLPQLPIGDWRARRMWLRALLAWLRPDIVHVQYAGLLLNVAPLWDGPLVVTVWGSDIYRTDQTSSADYEALATYLARADCVTCDSVDLVDAIRRFCAPHAPPTEVIQWGVDTALFAPAPGPSLFAREFGIADCTVFLSPRSFTPLYRLTDIVAAFAEVSRDLNDAVLLMKRYNAEPAYAEEVARLVAALGMQERVFIIDRIDYTDMVDYYRTGHILVSVPESDGTPMSLLEGMACGCYPIVSDVPSLHEWITDGENGRIVPIGSVPALAEAMLECARSANLGPAITANLQMVSARASQAANQEKMLGLYAAILEGR